jgi:bla regulator protein blaR1
MRPLVLGILWFGMAGEVLSQTSAPHSTFEVVSVKPSSADVPGMFVRILPGGGLRVAGATLKNLISLAYGVREFQISGGPKWIDTERFDIEARAVTSEAGAPTDPPKVSEERRKTNERLRSLLADRFQLTVHPETREESVYALVVAKGGPKLQESTESGSSIRTMGRGALKGRAVGLGMLTLNLSNELGRPVIDKTGLTAKYSI